MDFFSNLKLDDLVSASPGLLALVLFGFQWLAGRKKNEKEVSKTDAETENIHAEVADKWAAQVDQLLTRVSALEKELVEVRTEVRDYQDWANQLVYQVRALGQEPVPFRLKTAPKS